MRERRAGDERGEKLDGRKRVLVVEDDFLTRKMMGEMLNLMGGIEVVEAEDGQQGADFLGQPGSFDLVVTDLDLPLLDGLGLIKGVREGGNQEVPIILTTGRSKSELPELSELGVVFLQKPCGFGQLCQLVKDAFSDSKAGNLVD